MSDEEHQEQPPKLWTDEAVEQAKQSALPIAAMPIADELDLPIDDVVDAIEAALLTLTIADLDRMEEATRNALRPVVEQYAVSIGVPWETAADAMIGALEWAAPNPSKWVIDAWGDGRRRPKKP
jgi:hypothetical protein